MIDPGLEAQDEERGLRAFLASGTEIAGGLTGAGIGLLVAGPPGAILGAAASPMVTRALRRGALELMHRQLSDRERVRAAGVATIAAARIQRNLDLGHEARHDGFFQGEPGNRSAAEELAEGVLIAAQREHEEKKLPYLANLLANIAFQDGLSRSEANLLLRLADRLSYRQLCLIAIFGRKEEFPNLRDGTFESQLRDDPPQEGLADLYGVLEEADELMNAGMLVQNRMVLMGHGEGLNPADVQLQRWGAVLYELMDLNELPGSELEPLAEKLR